MPTSKMRLTQNFNAEFWNDSCDPRELAHAVKEGATGATSNPVIVANVFENNKEACLPMIDRLIKEFPSCTEDEIVWKSIHNLAIKAAKVLEPVFIQTGGLKGRLSIQVNPRYFTSAEKMTKHGLELSKLAPNIAIKIPAIPSGILAMEELTAEGVSINATVSFSVSQAVACAEAVERGKAKAAKSGIDTTKLSSFITIMVGRIDDHIIEEIKRLNLCLDPELAYWSGISVFKHAYGIFKEKKFSSKLLAAAYRHHRHWSEFIGGDLILSMPYKYWNQFNQSDVEVYPRMDQAVDAKKIEALRTNLEDFRKSYDLEGMNPSEFLQFGASKKTLMQFLGGLDRLNLLVRSRMLSL